MKRWLACSCRYSVDDSNVDKTALFTTGERLQNVVVRVNPADGTVGMVTQVSLKVGTADTPVTIEIKDDSDGTLYEVSTI